jgi:transposase
MSSALTPIEVFCSYAHEDESHLGELKTHLSGLLREDRISTWYDRQIQAGTNRAQAIDTHLEQACIILLLVSATFLASDYCYEIEMRRAMHRHQAGHAQVIPIIVILDDLSIHLGPRVKQAIEARDCQLPFLPAYSPDFSPIEGAFSKLKTILRRVGACTREALQNAIIQALPSITPQDALGWFRHCGYPAPETGTTAQHL